METISISELKTHLSGELKKVKKGTKLIVLDHKHPVAEISPVSAAEPLFLREAEAIYQYKKLSPLIKKERLAEILDEERADRW